MAQSITNFFGSVTGEIVGGILALIVALIIFWLTNRKKRRLISYNITRYRFGQRLYDFYEKYGIKVEHDDQELEYFVIKIKNDGKEDISPENFKKPIEISFGQEMNFYGVLFHPNNEFNNKHIENQKIVIESYLLRSGIEYTISFFTTSFFPNYRNPDLSILIPNTKVKEYDDSTVLRKKILSSFLISLFTIVMVFFAFSTEIDLLRTAFFILGTIVFIAYYSHDLIYY